ncbi:MAG: hypothetical protein AAF125_19985 [Chloroflexota bacterium]
MASLEELRDHARLTYRYWPIYLMLRLRELEQHIDPDKRPTPFGSSGRAIAPDVAGLVQAGLWRSRIPADTTSPPPLTIPDEATLCFEVETSSDTATLVALAQGTHEIQQVKIMRVPSPHEDVLTKAVDHFSRVALSDPIAALDMARLWAALHGARALDWQQVSVSAPKTASPDVPLPRRRRGKGQFRTPY